MSTENAGPAVVKSDSETPAPQPACCCSCGCSHKKWIVLLLILVVLAGGTWTAYWLLGGKLRATEAYQIAMQKIRSDPQLRDLLGTPIAESWRTAGRAEENEIDLRFVVWGYMARASVHAHGKPIQGKWDLDTLDVTVVGFGKTLKLLANEAGGAPPFDAQKAAESPATDAVAKPAEDAKPQEPAPSPEINLDVPK